MTVDFDSVAEHRWSQAIAAARPRRAGQITAVTPSGIEVAGLDAATGDHVVVNADGREIPGTVIALAHGSARITSFAGVEGLKLGMRCTPALGRLTVPVGQQLLGRVLDALGRPIDNQGALGGLKSELDSPAPDPMTRRAVEQPFITGVRAIDTAIPLAKGQRIGIFAGSGVGKSTLLSMATKSASADVIVVALVGERGREVREFIDQHLGDDGMKKSVVVVSTGDEPALMRLTAAQTATRIAEDFRDEGLDVLLILDSVTRFAMAQREIGLSAGELPVARGYPPSVLTELPKLLERAGNSAWGTMTAIYTVLVDGDDMNDPVADAVRGILDGHIVLSRQLANSGHFPAIDVLQSVSRLAATVHNDHQQTVSRRLRELMAEYTNARDLLEVGAYVPGASKSLDDAVEHMPDINRFLMQGHSDQTSPDHTWRMLEQAIGMPRAEAREPSAPASPRERAAA